MRTNNSELSKSAQKRPEKDRDAQEHFEKGPVLTQEELLRWWPFTRLDPKRFPKPQQAVYPEATF